MFQRCQKYSKTGFIYEMLSSKFDYLNQMLHFHV